MLQSVVRKCATTTTHQSPAVDMYSWNQGQSQSQRQGQGQRQGLAASLSLSQSTHPHLHSGPSPGPGTPRMLLRVQRLCPPLHLAREGRGGGGGGGGMWGSFTSVSLLMDQDDHRQGLGQGLAPGPGLAAGQRLGPPEDGAIWHTVVCGEATCVCGATTTSTRSTDTMGMQEEEVEDGVCVVGCADGTLHVLSLQVVHNGVIIILYLYTLLIYALIRYPLHPLSPLFRSHNLPSSSPIISPFLPSSEWQSTGASFGPRHGGSCCGCPRSQPYRYNTILHQTALYNSTHDNRQDNTAIYVTEIYRTSRHTTTYPLNMYSFNTQLTYIHTPLTPSWSVIQYLKRRCCGYWQ